MQQITRIELPAATQARIQSLNTEIDLLRKTLSAVCLTAIEVGGGDPAARWNIQQGLLVKEEASSGVAIEQ